MTTETIFTEERLEKLNNYFGKDNWKHTESMAMFVEKKYKQVLELGEVYRIVLEGFKQGVEVVGVEYQDHIYITEKFRFNKVCEV